MSEWLSFAASFAIVLSLLAALLFLLKKMQSGNLLGMSARKIRILETFSTGPRQRPGYPGRHHRTNHDDTGHLPGIGRRP